MPFRVTILKTTRSIVNLARVFSELTRAVQDQQADGNRFIAEYPPQLPGTRYRRTGTLKRSWHMPPVRRVGGTITGEVASQGQIAPYNRKVQGADQDPQFRRRNWRNVNDLVARTKSGFPRRVQLALNRAVR